MKTGKNAQGFIEPLDPAVAAALGEGQRMREDRSLSKGERARRKKAQARQEGRNGHRAVYDLEPELIAQVKLLADVRVTTASSVAGILLHYALEAVKRGDLELDKYRQPLERNPRYECELVWKEEK